MPLPMVLVDMEYEDEARLFNFLAGLVFGAVIGAGVTLVLAPDSGKKTRRRLRRVAGDLRGTAADRWDEIAEEVRGRVDEALQGARNRLS